MLSHKGGNTMAREEKQRHPKFIEYMDMIINHPNYRGLAIEKKEDGLYKWIATAKSSVGKLRINWCLMKAQELGFPDKPGMYADVMLAIHPTKRKVCQTCGREMSLYYHYPNIKFLNALNAKFGTNFNNCEHINDIWDKLISEGFSHIQIARFFIHKGNLNNSCSDSKESIIDALEYVCRKGSKTCLGPGAMSNFPDRFDGFHTYNRCCRASQDKGRSKENLKSYTKDRRAYEYWSDGNIHAANQFMGSSFFDGISADHIGPISLGFVHDPRYLQPMYGGDNSAKRDRLQVVDVEKIIQIEKNTEIYPMSWYSKEIWEHIKQNYQRNLSKVETVYREALKQNFANYMYVLWNILDNCPKYGQPFLIEAFLRPNFKYFEWSYEFNHKGEITNKYPRHYTDRNKSEFDRYCRIAIDAVYDYMDKDNRNIAPYLTRSEKELLQRICDSINSVMNLNIVKRKIVELLAEIQARIIQQL